MSVGPTTKTGHCFPTAAEMSNEDAANVYVGGLPLTVSEDVLRTAFVPFGELVDVHIPIDPKSGLSKGYGFVLYELVEDAAAAIDNMHNNIIHGSRVRVRHAHRRTLAVHGKALWHEYEDPRDD